MRILHTSDWHLGRSFHNVGMADAQQHAIDFIVDTITQRDIDLVLIAGDVYDRALPPVDAVAMFDQALVDMHAAGATVVVTSGNHDSAIRLGFMSRMMRDVYIRTMPEAITDPIVFNTDDAGSVCIWTVPYLEPRYHAAEFGVAANHTAVMRYVMDQVRDEMATRGLEGATHIMMAHLFAAGASGSESERNIGEGEVGTLGQVPADIFDGMDYVALGHLHGRQTMAPTVRYSGSPIAYSFSEANHTKGMWLLDIGDGDLTIEPVDIPQLKQLAVLKDQITPLLASDEYSWAEDAWCQITVTDPKRPPHAFRRLKERFPGMLNFILAPTGGVETQTTYSERMAKATTDMDLVLDFVDHVRNRPASESERRWLTDALHHVNRVKEQDVK
ncbi:metallophosphoesterase family protein [Enteractinococcus coprophilus]|uniref:Nuclease SbcCD subunit D n=1 Tax=Enteractinococcus coprophilus TaxID=1027633 RepID=A0A543AIM3_9MICC|nr:exonuclease subunit SbcD [Enteractinococcus coprophilus]TQL72366.1 exodeoxyribonuclease I subunit D [Enteractinococcus coprophilus]